MTSPFAGPARPFTQDAIARAATALGCQVAAVRAVIDVESRGGFLSDKRPKILFERHYFSRLTKGRYDEDHPDISHREWGGYSGGSAEYDRLERAIALDRRAALKSASWGAFQIMGANHKVCGFDDVEDFVQAMTRSEDDHLAAFVEFVKANHLDDELARGDWHAFARGYNGPAYRRNRYAERMAAACNFHSAGGARAEPSRSFLRMGDQGEEVRRLQSLLGITEDGDFGPKTKAAVKEFQNKTGLVADGIVGPKTWSALEKVQS